MLPSTRRQLTRLPTDKQPDNQSKQPQHTREDFNDQNLDKQRRIRRISQRRTATIDTHTDTTNQVAHAHCNASPEEREARIHVRRRVNLIFRHVGEVRGEDDGHDDAVDGHDFAEDNGYQILRSYSWCFDAASED
jgi:hypothetical protein